MTVQNMPLRTTPDYATTPYTDGASAAPVIACTLTGAKNAHLQAKKANPAFNPMLPPNDSTNKLVLDNPSDLAQGAVCTGIGHGASGLFSLSPNAQAIHLAHQKSIVRGDPVNIPADPAIIDMSTLGQPYSQSPLALTLPSSCLSFIGGGCSKTDPVTLESRAYPWLATDGTAYTMLGCFGGGQSRDVAYTDAPTKYYMGSNLSTDATGLGDVAPGASVTISTFKLTNIQTTTVPNGKVAFWGGENTALQSGFNTNTPYPAL